MTNLKRTRALDMLNQLVQREINGHDYINFKVEKIDYLGGYQITIQNVPLLQDNDLLGIIAVCNKLCLQFNLELTQQRIVLI